jgi:hypothetical protein
MIELNSCIYVQILNVKTLIQAIFMPILNMGIFKGKWKKIKNKKVTVNSLYKITLHLRNTHNFKLIKSPTNKFLNNLTLL